MTWFALMPSCAEPVLPNASAAGRTPTTRVPAWEQFEGLGQAADDLAGVDGDRAGATGCRIRST